MLGLFGRKDRIICPRCLSEVRVDKRNPKDTTCSCDFVIPQLYVEEYAGALPVYIQMFGWSQSGKSTWLDVLRLHLYNVTNVWPNSYVEAVTQIDIDHKEILRTERLQGKMPGATPKKTRDQNEVYLNLLKKMERWSSRFLVIMDHAGEMFERLAVPVKEIPFLIGTPTTIMLVCLPDMQKTGGKTFFEVVQIYVRALKNYGVNFKKEHRRLVIVFSKADLIVNLPANLREYLETDELAQMLPPENVQFPFTGIILAEYIERMARVSEAIRQWVDTSVEGGRAGLLMLRDNNVETRFVIMSSIGQEAGGAILRPKRVLDPFFWALEFQSREK